jgi:hypothetical protein
VIPAQCRCLPTRCTDSPASSTMPARRRGRHSAEETPPVRTLGVLLLADARDDDEELAALLLLAVSFRKPQTKRHGRRGPYTREKAEEFLELLLEKFSEGRRARRCEKHDIIMSHWTTFRYSSITCLPRWSTCPSQLSLSPGPLHRFLQTKGQSHCISE